MYANIYIRISNSSCGGLKTRVSQDHDPVFAPITVMGGPLPDEFHQSAPRGPVPSLEHT